MQYQTEFGITKSANKISLGINVLDWEIRKLCLPKGWMVNQFLDFEFFQPYPYFWLQNPNTFLN